MARIDQEAINTFTTITGLSAAVAIQKLQEHHGDINDAVGSLFTEANNSITQDTYSTPPRNDVMGIDHPLPFKSIARDKNPLRMNAPTIDKNDNYINIPNARPLARTRCPLAINVRDEANDIEEYMIRTAIEASKQEAEDIDLALAVTLSLQTAEKQKGLMELEENVEASEQEDQNGRQPMLKVGISSEDIEDLTLSPVRRRHLDGILFGSGTTQDIDGVNLMINMTDFSSDEVFKTQLAEKEPSSPDDANAITINVQMPDGTRSGWRFLKSDKLEFIIDFIDFERGYRPGSYRLVRPSTWRAFGDGDSTSTLSELGLTSKEETLHLEFV